MPPVINHNPSAAFISFSKQKNWGVTVLLRAKEGRENAFHSSDPIFKSAQLLT